MLSMRSFRVESFQFSHAALPPGARLDFAHISDLHLRRWEPQHDRLLETLNGRRLDFVVLTGDFLTTRRTSVECAARLIGQVRCRCGLYAVRGNWEVSYGPPLRRLKEMMRSWGATLLANESATLSAPAGRVRIVGIDDLYCGSPDFLQARLPDGEAAHFTILLSHSPLAASLLPPGHGVHLVLSGHTHGGQIRVPFLWTRLLPRCHGGFSDGLYELGRLRLYVSRGFGAVGILPVRFNCPGEVALFHVSSPPPPSGG